MAVNPKPQAGAARRRRRALALSLALSTPAMIDQYAARPLHSISHPRDRVAHLFFLTNLVLVVAQKQFIDTFAGMNLGQVPRGGGGGGALALSLSRSLSLSHALAHSLARSLHPSVDSPVRRGRCRAEAAEGKRAALAELAAVAERDLSLSLGGIPAHPAACLIHLTSSYT